MIPPDQLVAAHARSVMMRLDRDPSLMSTVERMVIDQRDGVLVVETVAQRMTLAEYEAFRDDAWAELLG